MNLQNLVDSVGTLAAIAAIASLMLQQVLERLPARRMLRLGRTSQLDVVASTSGSQSCEGGDAAAYLTAIGEIRAMEAASRAFARHLRKKPIHTHLSQERQSAAGNDLLLLGGPLRNERARSFLKTFNSRYPAAMVRLDATAKTIALGGREIISFDQRATQSGVPTEDLGLIVVGPLEGGSDRRVLLCAGLSTYGTEAAARFLFEVLARAGRDGGLRQWVRSLRHRRYRRLLGHRAAALVVHCTIDGRTVRSVDVYSAKHAWCEGQADVDETRTSVEPTYSDEVDFSELDAELLRKVFVEAMPPAFVKVLPSGRHVIDSDALLAVQHTSSELAGERLARVRADHESGDARTVTEKEWLQLEYSDTWSLGRPRLILTRKRLIRHAGREYVAGWYVPVQVDSILLTGSEISLREDAQQVVFRLAESALGEGITVPVGTAVRSLVG